MNAIGPGTIDDVIQNVAAEISVVNSLHRAAFDSKALTDHKALTDIVDHISNDVVVTGLVISVIDTSSAAFTGCKHIMDLISDDPHERAIIQDANAAIAADVKSHNVDVIGGIEPHILHAGGMDLRAPLYVRDEANTSARCSADSCADRSIISGGHMHGGTGFCNAGRVL